MSAHTTSNRMGCVCLWLSGRHGHVLLFVHKYMYAIGKWRPHICAYLYVPRRNKVICNSMLFTEYIKDLVVGIDCNENNIIYKDIRNKKGIRVVHASKLYLRKSIVFFFCGFQSIKWFLEFCDSIVCAIYKRCFLVATNDLFHFIFACDDKISSHLENVKQNKRITR